MRWNNLWIRWPLFGLLAAVFAATAAADPEESFKKAIAVADLNRWQEAAQRMREAIAEDPQESGKRIFLSGVFSRPYLPHYYLGWILFNTERSHCEEALAEWDLSEAQGVIQGFKRQHQDLQRSREVCNGLLLPSALAAAAAQIERAAGLEQGVGELPPGSGARRGAPGGGCGADRGARPFRERPGRLSPARPAPGRESGEGRRRALRRARPDRRGTPGVRRRRGFAVGRGSGKCRGGPGRSRAGEAHTGGAGRGSSPVRRA